MKKQSEAFVPNGGGTLNSARAEVDEHPQPVPPSGTAPEKTPPPPDDRYLHRTAGNQQRFAKAFLAGTTPGLMQRYAPDAATSEVEGWVEDDETVEELRRFREEFPYG